MIYSPPPETLETDKVTNGAIRPGAKKLRGLTNALQNEPFLQLLASAAAGPISAEPVQLWRWHGRETFNGLVTVTDGAFES